MTNRLRIAILAQSEQAGKFVRSTLRYKPETTDIFIVTNRTEMLRAYRFNLIIETERFHAHPMGVELMEEAKSRLV